MVSYFINHIINKTRDVQIVKIFWIVEYRKVLTSWGPLYSRICMRKLIVDTQISKHFSPHKTFLPSVNLKISPRKKYIVPSVTLSSHGLNNPHPHFFFNYLNILNKTFFIYIKLCSATILFSSKFSAEWRRVLKSGKLLVPNHKYQIDIRK